MDDSPSPCTGVCRIDDDNDLCAGCLRSLAEIAAWSAMDGAARRAVRDRIAQRRRGVSA